MNTTATSDKPLRADARRNREKVIAAARDAFAECGTEAQMDDIARRAGVGVGTLYRHFPTKDALVRAIVRAHMDESAARGRALLEDDLAPWEAFATFIRTAGLKDRALAQVVATQPAITFVDAARDSGLVAAAEELLRRAQEDGSARPDARVDDIPLLMCGLGAVLRNWDEDAARRYIELFLDGLRADGRRSELPDFRTLERTT